MDESTGNPNRESQKSMRERAARYPLQIPIRYRVTGKKAWSEGRTINLSQSGVLFSSDDLLEINTLLDITFQVSGPLLLSSSTKRAQIVRRTLNSWPETSPVFAAKFR